MTEGFSGELPDRSTVHLWRVRLDETDRVPAMRALLSTDERQRADRLLRGDHSARFTIAHGWKRRILAAYLGASPHDIAFTAGVHGKPSLDRSPGTIDGKRHVEFNLSHSGEIALIAVTRDTPVGVDVERWDANVEHLALAERFFSPSERHALHGLVERAAAEQRDEWTRAGFFAAWSRKEAYLKATGFGITRGLHHFDVTIDPAQPPRLLADRLDVDAIRRWRLHVPSIESGYSAAVVTDSAISNMELLNVGEQL